MAGSRIQKNKPHKTRFASKSSRNLHKTAPDGGKAQVKPPSHGQTARLARLQRNKNIRSHKRSTLIAEKRASVTGTSPPRILALIPLSSEVDVRLAIRTILSACESEDTAGTSENGPDGMDTEKPFAEEVADDGPITVRVPRYKLRLTILNAPRTDFQRCLEVVKVADVIAFVTPAVGGESGHVDKLGNLCLSMVRAQGMAFSVGLILGLSSVSIKKRSDVKKAAIAALHQELSEDCRTFSVDCPEDCQQILRHVSEHRTSGPQWRNQRPYVFAHQLSFQPDSEHSDKGTLQLAGYLRGRGMSVNQLVHVAGVGDFQLQKIDILEDPFPLQEQKRHHTADMMLVDGNFENSKVSTILPDEMQEPLVTENIPDELAGEQTWPTEDELTKAGKENPNKLHRLRRLPKGTSTYQAAWIVDEISDEEANFHEQDEPMGDIKPDTIDQDDAYHSEDDDADSDSMPSRTGSIWDEDDTKSAAMDNEDLSASQREAELRIKEAHKADEEYPDEVDTPTDIPARQRFAKYRGLKSFRTSTWDPKESLPQEYGKIFAFDSFNRTAKYVHDKASQVDMGSVEGSVRIGTFVKLHITKVPHSEASSLLSAHPSSPLVVCGLLQHESKMSVLHFSIRKNDSYSEPVKSKDQLIFHTGFRRFTSRPIFSTDDINMDKHKFERFLHPGRFTIASVFCPISFGPLPVLVFKSNSEDKEVSFVASGATRNVDPDRIILKKIVLSGFPHSVSKRKAVVRYMFHNPEDVMWFKPLEVYTKYGRRGRIKEPVGTHGAMKCIFDGVVQQRDAVCVSLFRRVYPKWPSQ
ncbi:hypothetical protein O6H91_11G065700 [Diphasiastrum complanatum]|uniref:Uncharacterized protein n=5 Tax=Diphasiastrum complanatum TaxID=34168 RepID=A0ACC2CA64_DIPCM|nr:hypothetical protein O6H91_11G065700 [Diphasiastrum complanatum]KAJ7538853.1 hypothetical protein O6H91_11G065700 [Diphasiastrum complanatum]KAJ7538854.1 hypothetical protein O6H91_11G065700 [Diphasiastrum complanatum]KAJ7538855.1 hypothetical protein O6H91_11G065700 [Diphasiastrum complanatum]KAJ7538856.1 hypothetical protein O6H91_11G065700 [Diphasiastrum complanatum]